MSEAGPGFFLMLAAIVLVWILAAKMLRSRNSGSGKGRSGGTGRGSGLPAGPPPAALGVPAGHPARTAAERLEAALSADFEDRVKDRVMKRNLSLRDREWDWTWFELKRYFLMCGVLRGVPMYSAEVDEVWHEMLMFTREYEQFCSGFCGCFIHHAPHGQGERPAEGERAWFDWVYGELFAQTPASGRIWGAFYRVPMSQARMEELETLGIEDLRERYFNRKSAGAFDDLDATVRYLIDRGRELAGQARGGGGTRDYDSRSTWDDPMMSTGLLSGLLFTSSMLPEDQFYNVMDSGQTDEQQKANSACSGSFYSCDGDGGDSGDGSESGGSDGGDGGSSDGGSSCSSGGDGGSSCSSGGDGGSSCGGGCGGGD